MGGLRWSNADLKAHRAKEVARIPQSKFRNVKKAVNGIEFDSTKEANRYKDLLVRMQAKDIRGLETQRAFAIEVNGEHICDYIADFVYTMDGKQVVEDVKSKITRKQPVYRLKIKLMKAVLGITVQEV